MGRKCIQKQSRIYIMETLTLCKFLLFSLLVVAIVSCDGMKSGVAQNGDGKGAALSVERKVQESPQDARSVDSAAIVIKGIRDFVLAYEKHPSDSLLSRYLTPHAREMYHRMVMEHDCDMLVLAQDTPDDLEQTLSVRSLGEGWYQIAYSVGNAATTNCLYIQEGKGFAHFRIAFIKGFSTHEGNKLFYARKPEIPINMESAESFLCSFYQAYAALYCSLDVDVEQETEVLRRKFLSPQAQQQYEDCASGYLKEGMDGYDVLVGGFYTTLEKEQGRSFKKTAEGCFVVNDCLKLSVCRDSDGSGFIIDGIRKL